MLPSSPVRLFSFSLAIAAFAVLAHFYLYRHLVRTLALNAAWRRVLGALFVTMTLLIAVRRPVRDLGTDIEHAHVVVWAIDPWASACERTSYAPGQLAMFWPVLIEPQGRIHFVGAYADNLNWGMEAATRSANRVAEAIDRA